MTSLDAPSASARVADALVAHLPRDLSALVREYSTMSVSDELREICTEADALELRASAQLARLIELGVVPAAYSKLENPLRVASLVTSWTLPHVDSILHMHAFARANQQQQFTSYPERCYGYVRAHRAFALSLGLDEKAFVRTPEGNGDDVCARPGACPYTVAMYSLYHDGGPGLSEVRAYLEESEQTGSPKQPVPRWMIRLAHRLEDQRRVFYVPLPADCNSRGNEDCFWQQTYGRSRCDCWGCKHVYNDVDVAWETAYDLSVPVEHPGRCTTGGWFAGRVEVD